MSMRTQESIVHEQVCDYLRLKYPDVLYRTDFAAGEKLSMSQAVRNKRLQKCRAWPDVFVARPKMEMLSDDPGWAVPITKHYCGLFIELKRDGERIFTKDGRPASPHLAEQLEVLNKLRERGYKAEFAVGFNNARKIIDEYLT